MITYVTGDATKPVGNGRKIIAHVTNDEGGWGAGLAGGDWNVVESIIDEEMYHEDVFVYDLEKQ